MVCSRIGREVTVTPVIAVVDIDFAVVDKGLVGVDERIVVGAIVVVVDVVDFGVILGALLCVAFVDGVVVVWC